MPFTLAAPPGFVDLADSELAAEKFAQGQHLQKIIENYKFGTVRPEFFYMGRFVDGDVVGLPQSKVDRLPYAASEVTYLWMPAITANPNTGITGGPGTVLFFDWQVEQFGDNQPGLVHTKTIYHVQGGQTTETTDGKLSVWAVAVRGKGIVSMAAVPAWNNQADSEYDLDSAWTQQRARRFNRNAKRAVVQAEFFDMGEFGNGQTVPQPVSDVDGFTYPYADVLFLPCWRWTPAFSSGQTSGPAGATISRMQASVAAGTGVVSTTVSYRLGGFSETNTSDGRLRVFAFCFRGGLTITGTTAFTDVDGAGLASGKKMNDKNMVEVNQSIKFAALRPEFFLTTQAHGTTVPLPTSPVDGYGYSRSELIYMAIRQDTAATAGSLGSLLTLHGFVRQDTGAVVLNTFYFRQGGSQTNTNNGTLRVLTIALRSDAAVTDSDEGGATGGGTGSDGGIEGDNVNPPPDRTWLNDAYADGSDRPTRMRRIGDDLDADDIFRYRGTGAQDLDNVAEGTIYSRLRVIARDQLLRRVGTHGQNLLFNPGLEDGANFWWLRQFSGSPTVNVNTNGAHTGNNYLRISATSSGDDGRAYPSDEEGTAQKYFEVNPDDVVVFGTWALTAGDGSKQMTLMWVDKDKVFIASSNINVSGGSWTQYVKSQVMPSNAKYVYLRLKSAWGTVITTVRFDDLFLQIGVSQRRLNQVSVGSFNSSPQGSGSPLTASDAGATASILVSAFTMQYGFGTVSFNSYLITGLGFNTQYYVFGSDPTYAGGAVTFQASTLPQDVVDDEGLVFAGRIITPADGGGGTGGEGGGGGGVF
jgi:hypothetical protein